MIEQLLKRADQLFAKVDEAKNLRLLADRPEWKALEASVQRGIVARINRVCAKTCDEKEGIELRAELDVLRWFLAIVKVDDKEFKAMVKEQQDLRKTVDRLHTLGQVDTSEYESFVQRADRLARQVEATS